MDGKSAAFLRASQAKAPREWEAGTSFYSGNRLQPVPSVSYRSSSLVGRQE
jgi:hypothetical protein